MLQVAIFASGKGTNAQQIIESSRSAIKHYQVSLLVCNNPAAGIMSVAIRYKIPVLIVNRETFYNNEGILPQLEEFRIDYIVLAGYLWMLPASLIEAYRGRIVNLHPALLPKYGGKGMYGMRVHQAVLDAKDPVTGITIHEVNEQYDEGSIIFQAQVDILPTDSAEDIRAKVQVLEHQHFPEVVENLLEAYYQAHPKRPKI